MVSAIAERLVHGKIVTDVVTSECERYASLLVYEIQFIKVTYLL